jgi:hypothetical protein
MSQIKKSIIREEPNVGKIDDRIAMANSSDNPDTVSLSFKYDTKGKVVQSPQVWFDNFADDMLKFAKSGATEDLNTLNTSLKRILVAFGDRIDDGTGNPVYGIRLGATADASGTFEPTKFKLLQKVLESKVYQKWGAMRSKSYEAAVTSGLTRKGSDLLADINLPKFTATKEHVDKLEDILEDEIATLQQAFIIPVQAPNGETRSVKLIDLDRMLERERDISKIVLGFEEGAESFKALDNQWKIFLNQAESADVSRKSILVDNAMQKLNMIINGSDGKGYMNFYETYINNSSPSNFKLIREMFTKGVQAGPEKLSDTMTKQEFDLAAINALTSGILSKNKYGTDTYRIPDLNGNMQEIKTLENPLNFKDEFQKDNIQLIAEEIMGKKHVQDVNVILEAMHREISANAYRSLRGSGMGGLTRPISPNEIISRAFNLARGMVSPAYVTAEMLLRIASTNNIEVTRLVLQDKEVANVFSELMIDPKGFDVIKIRPIVPRLQEFVFSELVAKGKVNLLVNYEEIFNQGEEDEDLQ